MIIKGRILRLLTLALVAITGAVSCGSEEEEEPFGFPLATGNTWQYEYVLDNAIEKTLIDSVGSVRTIEGKEYFRLYRWFDGEKFVTDELVQIYVRSIPDTAFYFLEVDARDDSIINEIPYEITDIDGHDYSYDIRINDVMKTAFVTAEQVNLSYEGENYTGFLWTRTTEDTDDGTYRVYFIPGIGISRVTDNNATNNIRYDLSSFTLLDSE